ncbi:uncharacterized protein LOC131232314 [Magnolia sinica]|uniref:uncharacterized protein LOC131232314 n=1 Tax=Magnolia sinica TaxID=86752 RepID=UPI00265AA803|nr:uncharacterized protein LOC131232314 [Magnolia sinica]
MWVHHDGFQQVVKQAWSSEAADHPMFNILLKMKAVKSALRTWNKDVFGNIFTKIKEDKAKLADLELKMSSGPVLDTVDENHLNLHQAEKEELKNLYLLEEIFWKQKSTVHWLVEGDRNTRLFHSVATEKQRRMSIRFIDLLDDCRLHDLPDFKVATVDHFSDLFVTGNTLLSPDLLHVIPSIISQEHNNRLLQSPSLREVQQAVMVIPSNEASGPDGFSSSFFKACRDTIGADLHRATEFIFQGGSFPRAVTATLIYLIPKHAAPKAFSDFPPIGLCNRLYKIIANVISPRLSLVLPELVSP